MGLLSSSKSSKKTYNTYNTSTRSTNVSSVKTDIRDSNNRSSAVAEEGGFALSNARDNEISIVNNLTDGGAIAGALDFARSALSTATNSASTAIAAVNRSSEDAQESLGNALEAVRRAPGESENTKYLIGAVVVVAVVMLVKK